MLLVLDSNEYIFALGAAKKSACVQLIDHLLEDHPTHAVCVPRLVVDEVRRHLTPEAFREFIGLVNGFTTIDEDSTVPFELGAQYEARGLKSADAFIAAYAEWIGADLLVTENRHFLRHSSPLPFQILDADHCLKFLKAK